MDDNTTWVFFLFIDFSALARVRSLPPSQLASALFLSPSVNRRAHGTIVHTQNCSRRDNIAVFLLVWV